MKIPCEGCPFNDGYTEEATQLQNYGCLPTKWDMLATLKSGTAISCHMNDKIPCRGLDTTESCGILPYSVWYRSDKS